MLDQIDYLGILASQHIGQEPSQSVPGAVESDLGGRLGDPEALGYLAVREVFDVTQHHHGLQALGKLLDGPLDRLAQGRRFGQQGRILVGIIVDDLDLGQAVAPLTRTA